MIVYLDTSSLVKLYVPEIESANIKRLVETATLAATSQLAYVEARAAFARKRRERGLTPKDYRTVVQDFEDDWESYFIVDASSALVKWAGDLAEKHALRGYDAIHLASALTLLNEADRSVIFSCFDSRCPPPAAVRALRLFRRTREIFPCHSTQSCRKCRFPIATPPSTTAQIPVLAAIQKAYYLDFRTTNER